MVHPLALPYLGTHLGPLGKPKRPVPIPPHPPFRNMKIELGRSSLDWNCSAEGRFL